ncbi:MAG: asparaginase, partial [Curtobacterium sp.]
GAAVAVKTLDGAQRAGTLAALTLLERNGLVSAEGVAGVMAATAEQVLGGGVPVGAVRAGAGLR